MEPTIQNISNGENTIQTNFLGVVIDTENGTSNLKIRKALDKSFKLLDIMEFVKVTKFKLNMTMFDYFWQVMACNRSPQKLKIEFYYGKLYYNKIFTMKIGYIYAIENNFDSSTYIGLTTKTIKERFAQHLQAARSSRASCILHLFMAKHGPENFTIRELRRVEYHSIIELQLVEEECIKDFGDLNTTYNSRSYEMGGLTLNRIIKERKGKDKPISVSKVPSREDVMEIACEAEEYPNKKISLDKFVGLFIPKEENYGFILDDMTIKGKIHISRRVLEWFGYEGDSSKQKIRFKTMLKRNNISFREVGCKDKEIELYPTIKQEIDELPNEGAIISSKFLIMDPDDLKMAIMQLKTKNGHTIRQYYIDLEKLLKTYTEYTLYFNHREASRKITSLEQMMARMDLEREKDRQFMRSVGITLEEVRDQNEVLICDNVDVKRKLGIAVEDRAPLPVDVKKQERFVLIKRNDPDYMAYYTIRGQNEYTERRIKAQKVLFPQLVVLLDFKANSNSKTLFVRIKDKLKDIGVLFEGNNIDLNETITEVELMEEMKVINDSKRDV